MGLGLYFRGLWSESGLGSGEGWVCQGQGIDNGYLVALGLRTLQCAHAAGLSGCCITAEKSAQKRVRGDGKELTRKWARAAQSAPPRTAIARLTHSSSIMSASGSRGASSCEDTGNDMLAPCHEGGDPLLGCSVQDVAVPGARSHPSHRHEDQYAGTSVSMSTPRNLGKPYTFGCCQGSRVRNTTEQAQNLNFARAFKSSTAPSRLGCARPPRPHSSETISHACPRVSFSSIAGDCSGADAAAAGLAADAAACK